MKSLFFVVLIVLVSCVQPVSAQLAMSVEEAKAQGLDFNKLDEIYPAGVGGDSLGVFKSQEDEYVKAYYSMLQDLGSFLNDHDFYWGGSVRCFNRIYFDADGSVDYYLFDFAGDLPQSRQREFKELLGQFIITYKFALTAGKPFAQCSPANYRDPL